MSSLSRALTEHRGVTPRVRALLRLYLTPLVLVAGLVILVFYHFHGVLKLTTSQDASFHGLVTYSQGPMALRFNQNGGSDRPYVMYANNNLITYTEWNSLISVDGVTQELWNSDHGYSADINKRQVYNTMSGTGWQIVQVVTLVNDHTVQVAWSAVARGDTGNPPPTNIELNFYHTHSDWLNPTVNGSTFTAQVAPFATGQTPQQASSIGTIHVSLSGPAVTAQSIQLTDVRSAVTNGGTYTWSNQFMTRYTLTNPAANQLLPLATETITFQPKAGAASIAPVPTVPSH